MSLPFTKRVNSSMLPSFVGQTVTFVGKIIENNGTQAIMSASDKGQVEVHVNSQSQYGTEYVEVIGKVRDDLSIEEFTCANFGNSFDMDVYNELVTKMQQFPSVF